MEEHDVVRARRFELVDDEGTLYAVLTARSEDGNIALYFGNDQGKAVASLGVEKETKTPFIILKNSEEKDAVFVTVTNDETGTLTLQD
ncbi:MAG: hypothetical protein M3324_03130, partial [Actinomycetota bacterium]|nr:hypothetical protein [Actinomycetota bacterium]